MVRHVPESRRDAMIFNDSLGDSIAIFGDPAYGIMTASKEPEHGALSRSRRRSNEPLHQPAGCAGRR
jgi:hypothetical protein